jgi:predicted P-loop ATPase
LDIAALERDRDQLFAEAVDRYRHCEQWWPDPAFEKAHIKPEQEARRDADAWEPKIAYWLERTTAPKVLIWQVAQDALGIEPGPLSRGDQNRIAAALFAAGWDRASRTGKGQWWEQKTVKE